jgi:hypothetical protein
VSTRSRALVLVVAATSCACSRRARDIEPAPEKQRDGAPVTIFDAPSSCDLDSSGEVARDATWVKGCTLIAPRGVRVIGGATLTLEEGVTIAFGRGSALRVSDGTIVAKGSDAAKIVMTSAQAPKKEGDWIGVVIEDQTRVGSIFDHVVIEYAGKGPLPAALKIVGVAKLTLGAFTLEHDDGAGISLVPAPPAPPP